MTQQNVTSKRFVIIKRSNSTRFVCFYFDFWNFGSLFGFFGFHLKLLVFLTWQWKWRPVQKQHSYTPFLLKYDYQFATTRISINILLFPSLSCQCIMWPIRPTRTDSGRLKNDINIRLSAHVDIHYLGMSVAICWQSAYYNLCLRLWETNPLTILYCIEPLLSFSRNTPKAASCLGS